MVFSEPNNARFMIFSPENYSPMKSDFQMGPKRHNMGPKKDTGDRWEVCSRQVV
jgi:hypothetical protein